MKTAPSITLAFTCLVGTLLIAAEHRAEHTTDSLQTVKENVAKEKAVLVDVREKLEWDGGHVADAIAVPLSELEKRNGLKAAVKLLPKDRIIYTYCMVGMRALKAAEILKKQGYDARALKPGYTELLKAGFQNATDK